VITGRHPWKRIWLIGGLVLALGLSLRSFEATAMTISVSPGADHLRQAIANAAPGDVLHLNSGIHSGPVMIDKPISLIGEKGAVVKGSGEGSTITVAAPDVIVRGLTVTGSGRAIRTMDAGIFVNKSGHRALVEGNHLNTSIVAVMASACGIPLAQSSRIMTFALAEMASFRQVVVKIFLKIIDFVMCGLRFITCIQIVVKSAAIFLKAIMLVLL
jgi:nitrous oxidase accessory protein